MISPARLAMDRHFLARCLWASRQTWPVERDRIRFLFGAALDDRTVEHILRLNKDARRRARRHGLPRVMVR